MKNDRVIKDRPAGALDHRLRVYSDITELIANPDNPTPMVKLNRINPNQAFSIYLKLERYNPFGSVKDRIAFEMLKGLEVGNRTIVEPSSGNTGIALACVANALGIPIEIAVPERIPAEKKVMLRLLGVKLREADDALCPLFPTEGARGLVNALVNSPATKDSYVSPNQYENEQNVQAHYRSTGPEIWKQTQGEVNYFFAGFGTCGTISGVGKYLKDQNSGIKVIGVEPASPDHKLPGLKRITGLAEEYIPKILDRSVIDETVAVSDEDAYRTAIDLARKEGIPVGPTTGAILAVALRYARTNKGLAVVISPDDAFKYASFYQEVLETGLGEAKETEYDLTDLICPLSKVRAIEVVDNLDQGETVKIILGDSDSLKSVVKELKTKGVKPGFKQESDSRFVLTITV
ncbi:MAG: pyridoxal-phosphate dependent enzyme [Chloroflexi bacterium]|nr:pyridoxal-phosphate dependent enzyme [Chloroflexota bacterium]